MFHRRGGILSGRGRGGGAGGGGGGAAGSVLGSLGPRDGPMPPHGYNRGGMMHGGPGGPQGRNMGPGMPFQRPPLLPQGPPGRDAAFRNAGLLQMTMSKRSGGPDMPWDPKRQRMDMGRQSDMGFNRRGGRGHDGGTEYDPSRPTEDNSQEHFCRICKISCWDEESMERHMSGKKHQAVVENMRRGGPNMSGPSSGGGGTREYCSTCGRWIEGSFESHKGSRDHQEKVARRKSGGKPGAPNSEKSSEKASEKTPTASEKPCSATEQPNSDSDKTNTAESKSPIEKSPPELSNKKSELTAGKKSEEAKETKKDEAEEKSANGKDASPTDEEQEGSVEEDPVIPEYAEKVSFGREYVVPVSGYFCRLCSKFYSSDTTAYDIHCRSRNHYEKYVAALEELRGKRNGEETEGKGSPALGTKGRGLRRIAKP